MSPFRHAAAALLLVAVLPAAEPCRLGAVLPDRLLYEAGDAVEVRVRVANPATVAQQVEVGLDLGWEMDEGVALGTRALALAPRSEDEAVFRWTSHAVLGAGAYARLRQDGAEVDRRCEFFGVAARGDALRIAQHTALVMNVRPEDSVAWDRSNYANVVEVFNWGGNPTAIDRQPEAFAGHFGWTAKADLRRLCRNPHGKRILAYTIYGTFKAEAERALVRRPDRFMFDGEGMPMGEFDLAIGDGQGRSPRHQQGDSRLATGLLLDFGRREVLDWYLDRLSASIDDIGWHGIRFDGHPQFPVPGEYPYHRSDGRAYPRAEQRATNLANARLAREHLRQRHPGLLLYYNSEPTDPAHPPDDLAELCAGGGVVGTELPRGVPDASSPYSHWRTMHRRYLDGVEACRRHGGYFSALYPPSSYGLNPAAMRLGYAVMYAAGAQPWAAPVRVHGDDRRLLGAAADTVPGQVVPFLKMGTRYSAMLWGPGLSRLADPAPRLRIDVPADAEVWWRDNVQMRTSAGGRSLLIAPLLNAPPSALNLGLRQQLPRPVDGLRATWRPCDGRLPARAWVVTPFPDTACRELELVRGAAEATAALPRLEEYMLLVASWEAPGQEGNK